MKLAIGFFTVVIVLLSNVLFLFICSLLGGTPVASNPEAAIELLFWLWALPYALRLARFLVHW